MKNFILFPCVQYFTTKKNYPEPTMVQGIKRIIRNYIHLTRNGKKLVRQFVEDITDTQDGKSILPNVKGFKKMMKKGQSMVFLTAFYIL